MMWKRKVFIFIAVLFVGINSSLCWASAIKVRVVNAKGEAVGEALLKQKGPDVEMVVRVKTLTTGPHGMHIHGMGKCEAPDFKSAGPHFNPGHKQHGVKNPQGSHAGDLPNLVADKKGKAKVKALLKDVNLQAGASNSLLTKEGTALVIHAGPDDEMTDPAGNSGNRIACGVIKEAE